MARHQLGAALERGDSIRDRYLPPAPLMLVALTMQSLQTRGLTIISQVDVGFDLRERA